MTRIPATAVLITGLALSLWASGNATADETETEAEESSKSDCFYIRNINSWSAIDKKHVYLKEGMSSHYLITLFSSCPSLRFAHAIALSNHTGRMCPNSFGAITYRDSGMARQCRIDNVEAVGSKDEAVALAESRSE